MRRYTMSINGEDHEVDVEEVTSNSFRVQIAGRTIDVKLRDHQDLAQAMITPKVEVAHGHTILPASPSTAPRVTQHTPAPAPAPSAAVQASAPVGGGGAGNMTAPMPGVVLSVSAKPGQSVKRGDPLLVLEAMKMKNELRAQRDGTVASVPVEAGAQVAFGDVLVVFEP
ncbi:biotin/lipoyl-containing protein [Luteococcus sp.]|uniref:biotin/lipoyl-containing protein n=1 Tax=Luteococcus sp. TaxID=1969402 RepID=UPI00373592B4